MKHQVQAYRSLPDNCQKQEFLQKFLKGGKGRDLSFVKEYMETTKQQESTKTLTKSNWYNRTFRS